MANRKKKKNGDIQMDIRPMLPPHEMKAFQKSCYALGETMTSIVRRLVIKVAAGDMELLQRIRS